MIKIKRKQMINKRFIQKLRKDYQERNSERRQIISLSNVVLNDSKKTIFAIHRSDIDAAKTRLTEIEKVLVKLDKKFGYNRLNEEGAYRAGVEEYVEAKLFFFLSTNKKIEMIKGINLSHESYLGGICDVTGELVRRATNSVANRDFKEADKIKEIIQDVMGELIEFDFTGYLRTKYDQALFNLKKIEQINYEINIRK